MKNVYVLLSRTNTGPARVIRVFLRGPRFSHTSLSLTPDTRGMVSFARRKMNNVFSAGILVEDTRGFVFAKYPDCPCLALRIPVTDLAYRKLQVLIRYYFDRYEKCRYAYVGCFLQWLNVKRRMAFRFTCSQFVAHLLQKSGACVLPKDPSLMVPDDFLLIKGAEVVYEGPIGKSVIPKEE